MSIKSLFEDIADAIREKSGSSDTYTPAEMPSAIRSIPSGSSTASGVSYDNTSSELTASNVQDAIDELSGNVSTINSDLSKLEHNDLGQEVSLLSYTSTTPYIAPADGYVMVTCTTGHQGYGIVQSASNTDGIVLGSNTANGYFPCFVKKGMKLYTHPTVIPNGYVYRPLQ